MRRNDWLLCAGALLSLSGRTALAIIGLMAVGLAAATVTRRIPGGSLLAAVTVSGGLPLLTLLTPEAGGLWRGIPVIGLLLLCGAADTHELTPLRLCRGAVALLLTGLSRELLTAGTLLAVPVLPLSGSFGADAAGWPTVGGILIAAGVLWLIAEPVRRKAPGRLPPWMAVRLGATVAVAVVADGALTMLFPTAGLGLRAWLAVLIAVIPALLWQERYPAGWAVIPPLTVLLTDGQAMTAVLAGVIVLVGCGIVWAFGDRLERSRLPRRFAGPPAVLVSGAVLMAAAGAFG